MRHQVVCGAVAAALLSCASAQAQQVDTGFYVGVELGQSSIDVSRSDLDNSLISAFNEIGIAVLEGSSDLSDDDFTYGLILGYKFLPFLAVEAAYLDLGGFEYKAHATLTDGVSTVSGRAAIEGATKGPALSAIGILPFADVWNVYGRIGVYFSDGDYDVTVAAWSESASDELSDSTEEMFWGAGVGFSPSNWTTRIEFQQFMDVGSGSALGEADVSRITFGAMYRF